LQEPVPDLIAQDLACRRGERLVFTGLSLRLRVGGAILLTGANGSGKTSLLRLLAALMTPAAGRLLWGDLPINADIAAYRERLHFVGHQDGVKPGLTPRETLRFWAALRGVRLSWSSPTLEAALAAFGLQSVADWPCRWLSAGQRKRLALARLVASSASVWLLDEPANSLDRDNQRRLERVVAAHRASGGRVVVASHTPLDMPDADVVLLDAVVPSPGHAAAG
jgi:heme exporter protein A